MQQLQNGDTLNLTFVHLLAHTRRQLGRTTYVTPTSYLELLLTYRQLLCTQRESLGHQRCRYEVRV